jgi:hypothetical protein
MIAFRQIWTTSGCKYSAYRRSRKRTDKTNTPCFLDCLCQHSVGSEHRRAELPGADTTIAQPLAKAR